MLGKKSSHAKKGMCFEELKTHLHHTRRGVINLFEFKRGNWKVD